MASGLNPDMHIVWYMCQQCKRKVPVPRSGRNAREKSHIKTMWCTDCRKKRPHKALGGHG